MNVERQLRHDCEWVRLATCQLEGLPRLFLFAYTDMFWPCENEKKR